VCHRARAGATCIIAVDGNDHRRNRPRARTPANFRNCDVVAEVMKLTGGRARTPPSRPCTQGTFESALRARQAAPVRPRRLFEDLTIPLSAFAAGLGDPGINTALCPRQGAHATPHERVASGRVDLGLLVTHQYKLERIVEAYELFANQREGVLKVAIKPDGVGGAACQLRSPGALHRALPPPADARR
jgi:threonine dehydrogenase-like Zn-dependent dehydrogenase